MVLAVNDAPEALARAFAARLAEAPRLFADAPLVLDLAPLPRDLSAATVLPALFEALRPLGVVPVGVQGVAPEDAGLVRELGLALLSAGRPAAGPEPRVVADPAPAVPAALPVRPSLIIDQPVRSGQRVVAEAGDLVVLAPVASGAEVLAAGHIHLYAPLRGRAFAGMDGAREARLFCARLEPELIAIAGYYQVSEDIPPALWGRPALVRLDDTALVIEPLDPGRR